MNSRDEIQVFINSDGDLTVDIAHASLEAVWKEMYDNPSILIDRIGQVLCDHNLCPVEEIFECTAMIFNQAKMRYSETLMAMANDTFMMNTQNVQASISLN
ncbi:hypothetical protein [Mangrovibacter yixingensis]|uniref:hypothetical protein n=1 Tax=Mangrovibacter yixingensis TaxID=1529639 RepID=UPI001CFDBC71|nr:hypothetical protein [Mangrovibacter yixingensis]